MIHNYSTEILDDRIVSIDTGCRCYGYGTGESHERIIQSAGGEIGYDGFRDPRPGHEGKIYADRVFINQETNEIQGINFRTENGEFCCSYEGMDYADIKDSNQRDCSQKLSQAKSEDNSLTRETNNLGIKRN